MKPRIALAAPAAAALTWIAGPAGAALDLAAGKTTYEGGCVACHGTGVLGRPVGDAAAWKPRGNLATGGQRQGRQGRHAAQGRDAHAERPATGERHRLHAGAVQRRGAGRGQACARRRRREACRPGVGDGCQARCGDTGTGTGPAAAAAPAAAPAAAAKPATPAAAAAPAPAAVPTAAAPQAGGGVNSFNRLLRAPGVRNRPPAEDGIHDPANDGTLATAAALDGVQRADAQQCRQSRGLGEIAARRQDQPARRPPRPKVALAVMDLNIVREVKGSMPDVVYPHKQHTEWLDCSNCHRDLQAAEGRQPDQHGRHPARPAVRRVPRQGRLPGLGVPPVHSKPKSSATAEAMPTTAPASHQATR